MKAVLLAAGRGSRMHGMTDLKPKSLIEFNGEPLVSRAVRSMREGGVTEVGVVGGYRAEMLEPYADRMFMNDAWSSTGIFHSLSMAAPWLEHEACLISYSDIFYSGELVTDMLAAAGDIVIAYDVNAVALWTQRFDHPLLDLERFTVDGNRCVREIGGRATSLAEIEGQYMGLLKLTPAGWQAMRAVQRELDTEVRDNVDMTTLLSKLIQANYPIRTVANAAPWGEIDCQSDVHVYERLYPDL